jgi:hypothetical protein
VVAIYEVRCSEPGCDALEKPPPLFLRRNVWISRGVGSWVEPGAASRTSGTSARSTGSPLSAFGR